MDRQMDGVQPLMWSSIRQLQNNVYQKFEWHSATALASLITNNG